MTITGTVERSNDGTYSAFAVIGEHTVVGTGDTKGAATEDLRKGVTFLFEYLKSEGKPLPEIVGVEVAA